MIYSLEDKNKKELIVIVEHQIKEYQILTQRVAELEQAIMSNCYDDPSTSGKRLMALATQQTEVK